MGPSGNSRSFVNSNEINSFSYELILTGDATISRNFKPRAPITVKVPVGNYKITLKATADPANNAPGVELRGFGETSATIRNGQNIVPITMYSASEVTNWSDLSAKIDTTVDPADSERKEIMLLKNSSQTPPSTDPWSTTAGSIEISRQIKLIAEENVTITRGVNNAFFTVKSGGILSLQGSITLDGNKAPSNASPLISVAGGELHMYSGVTLQNNYNSSSSTPGGGVYVGANSAFYIEGGIVYGNDGGANANTNSGTSGSSSLYVTPNNGKAEYGIFIYGNWTSRGILTSSDKTIRVVNGWLR